jgi:hypothetical protein
MNEQISRYANAARNASVLTVLAKLPVARLP